MDEAFTNFASKSRLERERAVTNFCTLLQSATPKDKQNAKTELLSHLRMSTPWQGIHSSVAAAQTLVKDQFIYDTADAPDSTGISFLSRLQDACLVMIRHVEPRVREETTKLISTLVVLYPRSMVHCMQPALAEQVYISLTANEKNRLEEASFVARREAGETAAKSKLACNLVHETEGWHDLESNLLAFAALIRSSGHHALVSLKSLKRKEEPTTFDIYQLDDCLTFIARAENHANRFVREAALKLLDAVASSAVQADKLCKPVHPKKKLLVTEVLLIAVSSLQNGLSDNWSQVRYAASLALRTLLQNTPKEDHYQFYEQLLPPMCLNRHYVAEGVKSYSQQTWRIVLEHDGREMLTKYLPSVVDFYESQVAADNHAVREAACQALGELVMRLRPPVMREWAARIAQALVNAFKDESWPVRDHACRALADVVCKFPAEVDKSGLLPDMHELFARHLYDNIPSVRLNCASGFVLSCFAFDDTHPVMGTVPLLAVVRAGLRAVADQKEDAAQDAPATTGGVSDTQYGASTKLAGLAPANGGNDDAQTNQVMYSCGSLAPKLRRGGGCSDHGFVRPHEAWEMAEGALLVIRALMQQGERGQRICRKNDVLNDVMASGEMGLRLNFRHRSKFAEAILQTVVVANESVLPTDLDTSIVSGLLSLIVQTEKDDSEAVRRLSSECRRLVMRKIGLKPFAAAEQDAKEIMKKMQDGQGDL